MTRQRSPVTPARTTTRQEATAPGPIPPSWLCWGLCALGVAMVPWLWVLADQLPPSAGVANWSTAWVGLDGLEAASLFVTGLLLRRRDVRASLTAAVTSALLLVDAWFDITSASTRADLTIAIAMAALAELPLCVFCAHLALRMTVRNLCPPTRSTGEPQPCETDLPARQPR